MGDDVGDVVGAAVGEGVGFLVGASVGDLVVGRFVGSAVGAAVGFLDGGVVATALHRDGSHFPHSSGYSSDATLKHAVLSSNGPPTIFDAPDCSHSIRLPHG